MDRRVIALIGFACMYLTSAAHAQLIISAEVGPEDFSGVPGSSSPGISSANWPDVMGSMTETFSLGAAVAPEGTQFDFDQAPWHDYPDNFDALGQSLVPLEPPTVPVSSSVYESVQDEGKALGTSLGGECIADANAQPPGPGPGDPPLFEERTVGATATEEDAGSDPVDPGTGEYQESWVDLYVAGTGLDLTISRTYRSRSRAQTPLGHGWDLSIHQRIVSDVACDRPAILWATGHGNSVRLLEHEPDQFMATGAHAVRAERTDAGWVLHLPDGVKQFFELRGNLREIRDLNDNSIHLDWTTLATGEEVVNHISDTERRSFDLTWSDDASGTRTVTITGPLQIEVRYTIDADRDLVRARNMWGEIQEYSYLKGHPSQGHLATDELTRRCEESCGLQESECGLGEDPCREIADRARGTCESTCATDCLAAGCSTECRSSCQDACANDACPAISLCDECDHTGPAGSPPETWQSLPRRVCDNFESERGGDTLLEFCEDQCALARVAVCASCTDEHPVYLSNDPGALGSTVAAAWCFATCADCLGGAEWLDDNTYTCPEHLTCMRRAGYHCISDCYGVGLFGHGILPDICGGQGEPFATPGCVSNFSTACSSNCQRAVADCQDVCEEGCGEACSAPCETACGESCAAQCGEADLYGTCAQACVEGCVAEGSYKDADGVVHVTYGATEELNHNIEHVFLASSDGSSRTLVLRNIYEQDILSPQFDRVTSQEFGPAQLTYRYQRDPLGVSGVELCPNDVGYCPPGPFGRPFIERWVRLPDRSFAIVGRPEFAAGGLRAEWRVNGGPLGIPTYELVRQDQIVVISPPLQITSPVTLVGSQGTVVLHGTDLPGVLVADPAADVSLLPAAVTVTQSASGWTGHNGALLGIVSVSEGAIYADLLHMESDGEEIWSVPSDAIDSDVVVRELARRWRADESLHLTHPYSLVTLRSLDGISVDFPSYADLLAPGADLGPELGRMELARYSDLNAEGGQSFYSYAADATALKDSTPGLIGALSNEARFVSSEPQFLMGLDAQAGLEAQKQDLVTYVAKVLDDEETEVAALYDAVYADPAAYAEWQLLSGHLRYAKQQLTHAGLAEFLRAAEDDIGRLRPMIDARYGPALDDVALGVRAAVNDAGLQTAFTDFDRSNERAGYAVQRLDDLRVMSRQAMDVLAGWVPWGDVRKMATEADAYLQGKDDRAAHEWALGALSSFETRWARIGGMLPSEIDFSRLLREPIPPGPQWAPPDDPGWWIDRLFGYPDDLHILIDRCVDGQGYLPSRPSASAQRISLETTIVDGNGASWRYFSDEQGRLVRAVSPDGGQRDWNYDGDGRLIAVRSEFGDTRCLAHDTNGNVAKVTWFPAPALPSSQPFRETRFLWDDHQRLTAVYLPSPDTGKVSATPTYQANWDARGNLNWLRTPTGLTDVVSVDSRGRYTEVHASGGQVIASAYDSPTPQSSTVTLTTPNTDGSVGFPITISVVADGLGRPTMMARTGAPAVTFEWENHRLWRSSRANDGVLDGRDTRYEYDYRGDLRLVQDVDPTGQVVNETEQIYDERGLLVRVHRRAVATSNEERVSCYRYDGRHDLTEVIEPTGRRTRLVRDASGDVSTVEMGYWVNADDDPLCPRLPNATTRVERVLHRAWSSTGTLLSQSTSLDGYQYVYDGYGAVIQAIDDARGSIQRLYDGRGRVRALARRALYASDPLLEPTPNDLTLTAATAIEYDDADRIRSIRYAWFRDHETGRQVFGDGWLSSSFAYDDASGVVTGTFPHGTTRTWVDPVFGAYRFEDVDLATSSIRHELSGPGEIITTHVRPPIDDTTAPLVTSVVRNPLGLVVRELGADGRVKVEYEYDGTGALRRQSSYGIALEYLRNDFGEVVMSMRQEGADGAVYLLEEYGRDRDGYVHQVFDHYGVPRVDIVRDELGRIDNVSYPDGTTTEYDYVTGTNAPEEIQGRDGTVVFLRYDARGNIESVLDEIEQPVRTYQRDERGLLLTASSYDQFGEIRADFSWDSLGRPTREHVSLFDGPIEYQYNDVLATLEQISGGGVDVSYDFDSFGRIQTQGFLGEDVFYDWIGPGAAARLALGNGLQISPSFEGDSLRGYDGLDGDGEPHVRALRNASGQVVGIDEYYAGDTWSSAYGIGTFGGIEREAHGVEGEPGVSIEDAWVLSASRQSRRIDIAGNWSDLYRDDVGSVPVSTDASDVLTAFGPCPVQTDDARRTTGYCRVDGVELALEYDSLGEAVSITASDSGSGTTLFPRVDALGRLVEVLDENGDRVRAYRYALGDVYIEEHHGSERHFIPGPYGVPLAMIQRGEVFYIHPGWNARVAALTNRDGELVARYATTAFGEVVPLAPDGTPWDDPFDMTIVLGGQPSLPELGLHRMGLRWYAPQLGRFLSPDPAGFVDGLNLYAYVGNQPLLYTDPSGMWRLGLRGAVKRLLQYGAANAAIIFSPWIPLGLGPEIAAALQPRTALDLDPGSGFLDRINFVGQGMASGYMAANSDGEERGAHVVDTAAAITTAFLLARGAASSLVKSGDDIAEAATTGGTRADAPLTTGGNGAPTPTVAGPPPPTSGVQANRLAGQEGERFLAQMYGMGSEYTQVTRQTSRGRRVIDHLVDGTARESKVGRTSLRKRVQDQIAKDVELMNTPGSGVERVEWHFFPSSTGAGPTAPLRRALEQAGIDIVIHPGSGRP